MLRASRAWGVAPSTLLAWDVRDRTLAVALLAMEESTSRFGHDLAHVTDPRSEGEYEARTVTDWEQAALDQWHERNPKPGPGVKPYVVYVGSGPETHRDDAAQIVPAESDLPAV